MKLRETNTYHTPNMLILAPSFAGLGFLTEHLWLTTYQWTERHWQNDTLHGKVLVWDTNGKLTKEYVYQNGKQVSAKQYLDE